MIVTTTHVIRWLEKTAATLSEQAAYLTELDSPIGDADHGVNMARGFNCTAEQLPDLAGSDMGVILKSAASALISKAGGASGLLYGNFFLRSALFAAGKQSLSAAEFAQMLRAGCQGVIQRGRPEPGDKTMIDAWLPALAALDGALTQSDDLVAALAACCAAAEDGMKETIPMRAHKGRASYLGERSIGHQDPGATSTFLILKALYETLAESQSVD
jgi:dihydroxyacetone kinase-like protein